MTKGKKAKAIMDMALLAERQASRALTAHHVKLSGQVAMESEWNRQQKLNCMTDFDSNPYTARVAEDRQTLGKLMILADDSKEVLDLAIETFSGMIA